MKLFLAGLGAGAAIGVLLAPQSGSATRRQLTSKATEFGDAALEQLEHAKQIAQDPQGPVQKAKGRIGSMGKQATAAVADAPERLRSAAQSVASKAGLGPLVMLNTGSREDLLAIYGIGPILADKIIENRPYATARAVVERGIISETAFRELERELRSA